MSHHKNHVNEFSSFLCLSRDCPRIFYVGLAQRFPVKPTEVGAQRRGKSLS